MIIDESYLMLSKISEFSPRLKKYFYNRLQLFLNISDSNVPGLVFTTRDAILLKYRREIEIKDHEYARAFYNDKSHITVFDAKRYKYKTDMSFVVPSEIPSLHTIYDFKYIIPISDIYHEMIHHIQYTYLDTTYDYNDFIEACADIYAYIITGQWNIDYTNESIGFWYICTKILKCNDVQFYVLLRNAIIDENFAQTYLLSNKNFVKLLAKKYNGTISQFFHNFKKDFGDRTYEEEFYQFSKRIHNLIFYKY